jgi:hypothetical protein
MRRVFLVALLACALPMAAWASGIDLVNHNGSVSILQSGITSKGSQLLSFGGITATKGHSLGSVSFSTGAFDTTSGTIATGGSFSSAGSKVTIIGKGSAGQPKGVIFSGSFSSAITWKYVGKITGNIKIYQLSGTIVGQDWLGRTVSGTMSETIDVTKVGSVIDCGSIKTGDTHLAVPEPGTLGLLGTGLVGIAGMLRRKFNA